MEELKQVNPKITKCPHVYRKHEALGMCRICYQKYLYHTNPMHAGKVKQYMRKRYHTNPAYREKVLSISSRWAKSNPERVRQYQRTYAALHPTYRFNEFTIGLECSKCGFGIKTLMRYGHRRKVICPKCRASFFPYELNHILIRREP